MRNFCVALWHFLKNSFKLTNNKKDNIQLLNPLKTLDMLWPNTRQTQRVPLPVTPRTVLDSIFWLIIIHLLPQSAHFNCV